MKVRALQPVEDPSFFLAQFENETSLLETSCVRSGDYIECQHHGKRYSNRNAKDAIYVPYEGESLEDFVEKCFKLDLPKSYFCFNDFLPFIRTISENSNDFFRWADYPSSQFNVEFDRGVEGYNALIDYRNAKLPIGK